MNHTVQAHCNRWHLYSAEHSVQASATPAEAPSTYPPQHHPSSPNSPLSSPLGHHRVHHHLRFLLGPVHASGLLWTGALALTSILLAWHTCFLKLQGPIPDSRGCPPTRAGSRPGVPSRRGRRASAEPTLTLDSSQVGGTSAPLPNRRKVRGTRGGLVLALSGPVPASLALTPIQELGDRGPPAAAPLPESTV